MKKIKGLLSIIILLLTTTLVSQTDKHLWQLKSQTPVVFFNQSGQMAVFTYDRLSIYNVESGKLETTHDFLANRSPYIWPNTSLIYYSEDFKKYNFYGENKDAYGYAGKYVRFHINEEKWEESEVYKSPLNYSFTDIQGRDVIRDSKKKSVWLYKPNGKKIKEIVETESIRDMPGGKFGVYRKDKENYIINFTTDISKKIDIKGNANNLDRFPEWLIYTDGNNITLYNPYTNQTEVKSIDDKKKFIPYKYINCLVVVNKDFTFFGNYIYKVKIDESKMITTDQNGAVPYKIEQYDVSDCSLIKTFEICVSEEENSAKASSVGFIYDGLKFMADKKNAAQKKRDDFDLESAAKFASKKEAGELSKELLINFRDGGSAFSFSLSSLEGRDITNLPYTKKYLSHLKGEVYAITKFNSGRAIILVVAVRNGNNTSFKFVRIHYEGPYRSTRDIASVNTSGKVITEQLSVVLSNTGSSIKAHVTRTNIQTEKSNSDIIFAPCSGDW